MGSTFPQAIASTFISSVEYNSGVSLSEITCNNTVNINTSNIYLGNTKITSLYIGNTKIKEVYIGGKKILGSESHSLQLTCNNLYDTNRFKESSSKIVVSDVKKNGTILTTYIILSSRLPNIGVYFGYNRDFSCTCYCEKSIYDITSQNGNIDVQGNINNISKYYDSSNLCYNVIAYKPGSNKKIYDSYQYYVGYPIVAYYNDYPSKKVTFQPIICNINHTDNSSSGSTTTNYIWKWVTNLGHSQILAGDIIICDCNTNSGGGNWMGGPSINTNEWKDNNNNNYYFVSGKTIEKISVYYSRLLPPSNGSGSNVRQQITFTFWHKNSITAPTSVYDMTEVARQSFYVDVDYRYDSGAIYNKTFTITVSSPFNVNTSNYHSFLAARAVWE